ncbi:PKD domain-containing protein [Pedobacter sp. SYSU D00535]|uniref:PKD domain-containing protein n=1 Tax=Pedobacter sp. SYSU D00535 TaxID=2810308 RepID=UPI001A95FD96|nr:PKD domain-containing protein [Pedobacter sp. SYSU D00535]
MKRINFLYLIAAFLFLLGGCKEEEFTRIEPDGEFAVNFDFPQAEVFAPAKIVLTNRSKYSESYNWKFEGGKTLTAEGLSDLNTSTSLVPDTIYYALPGKYTVTLTATQGGRSETISKEITIQKMQPKIVVPANLGIMQEATFSANVFKYPNQDVTYAWDFGEPGLTSTEASPKVTFQDEGMHTVTLTINDGQETLTATAQVVVLGELVKTLYFTDVRTGKLYKKRFTQLKPSSALQLPANVGLHPLGINVFNNRVYISDAGTGVVFTSLKSDGRVFSVNLEGGDEKTITQPAPNSAYGDDPFYSTVDANGTVYFVTRFGGVRTISASAVDAAYPPVRFSVTAAHAGTTSTFGWLDGGLQVIDGTLWYSKHGSAGKGLYKYNASTAAFIEAVPGLKDAKIRNFAVDTKNGKIYFAINFVGGGLNKGFYRSNLDGSNIELLDAMPNFSTEGGANEQTYVTGIAIDSAPDDGTAGYVYWGYRDAADISATGVVVGDGSNSGIKRYALDGSKPVEFFLKGFIPYGIAIDHTKR